ncbi:MAG: polyamine aminopropyltransferase [Deltaproteobacteria bacterium]|nr:polyamine aminopropyltransferase [Deltaproteobacteria bacterium]
MSSKNTRADSCQKKKPKSAERRTRAKATGEPFAKRLHMSTPFSQGLDVSRRQYADAWSKNLLFSFSVSDVLHQSESEFQELLVVDTPEFGRMLILDGNLQCAERDEKAYHEFMVHPALCRREAAKRELKVLIIGGGDGGAAREVLRHREVKSVELVDIDNDVMKVSREHLASIWRRPELKNSDDHQPLDDDPRLHIRAEDGVAFLEQFAARNVPDAGKYDLIVVDASDPVGPGTVLYADRFYAAIAECLCEKGAVSVQSGSWFYFPEVLQTVYHGLSAHFPMVKAYECFSAIYPGGVWNLCLATKGDDPLLVDEKRAQALQKVGEGCDWYDEKTHEAAFALPRNARRILEKKPPSLEEVSERILDVM